MKYTDGTQAIPDDGDVHMHLHELHCVSEELDESSSSSTDDWMLEDDISGALYVGQ